MSIKNLSIAVKPVYKYHHMNTMKMAYMYV